MNIEQTKQEMLEEFDKLVEKGHGGGNWRILIIQGFRPLLEESLNKLQSVMLENLPEDNPTILMQDGVSYDFHAVEGFNQAIKQAREQLSK